MRTNLGIIGFALTVGFAAFSSVDIDPQASPLSNTSNDTGINVILLTMDGIRTEEFFSNHPDPALSDDRDEIFRFIWGTLATQSRIYGGTSSQNRMYVANASIVSLPAYFSIFSGVIPLCLHNECGLNPDWTFFRRISSYHNFDYYQAASIASWQKMRFAVGVTGDKFIVNAGQEPLNYSDPAIDHINALQASDTPIWSNARLDKYTHAMATRYFQLEQPRLLHVGYNDSDEWGHKIQYPSYINTLRTYDNYVKQWYDLMQTPPYENNTCLIITTDHGRGQDSQWYTHSTGTLSASEVFMIVHCPGHIKIKNPNAGPSLITHLAIRPTIEDLFGIKPNSCMSCGESLVENKL